MFVAGGFPTEFEYETAQYFMNTMEATGYFVPMLAIVKNHLWAFIYNKAFNAICVNYIYVTIC